MQYSNISTVYSTYNGWGVARKGFTRRGFTGRVFSPKLVVLYVAINFPGFIFLTPLLLKLDPSLVTFSEVPYVYPRVGFTGSCIHFTEMP